MTTQTPHDDVGADDTQVRIPTQPAEPRPPGRRRRRAPILRPTNPAIDILGERPATCLNVPPQLLGHWAYYRRELAGTRYEPSEDMPIVCHYFELVFPAAARPAL